MLAQLSKLLCTTLLATLLLGATLSAPVEARSSFMVAQNSQMSAREAAAQAKAQHGGKVLRVRKQGNVYKVRLLQKSGRVITVTVRG
ncbi:MAG: hypothetical protein AB8C02_07170 [Halioglobus sp.]